MTTLKTVPGMPDAGGIFLGRNKKTGNLFSLSPRDRTTHCHVLGQSGKGKSSFLESCVLQDILAADGVRRSVTFLDPHGESVKCLLALIARYRLHRRRRIRLLRPADPAWSFGFNPFVALQSFDLVALCDLITTAILQVWGQDRTTDTPLLSARCSTNSTRTSEPPAAPQPVTNPPLRFALTLNPDYPYLRQRGIPPEVATQFGLGQASRGLMKGRIAIAIHNERGALIAYAGRWPAEDGWPQGEDKYKLPEGFKKRHVLFNLHRCLDETGRLPGGYLVITEGYFGALWLYRLGFPAVALMGRSLAPEQQALLKQVGAERLSLMLDGDAPGRAAVAIMLPHLASSFFVRDIVLPKGAQPDTLDEISVRPLLN